MPAQDDKLEKRVFSQQEKFQQARRIARDSALSALLQTYEGRAFCWWVLEIGGIGRQPFDPGANALRTAFNCGELNVGQQFLAAITETDPASYVRMMQENQNDYRTHVTASPDTADPIEPGTRPGHYDTSGGPDTVTG